MTMRRRDRDVTTLLVIHLLNVFMAEDGKMPISSWS